MNIAEQWHKRFQEAPLSKNAGYFWGLISAALAVFLSASARTKRWICFLRFHNIFCLDLLRLSRPDELAFKSLAQVGSSPTSSRRAYRYLERGTGPVFLLFPLIKIGNIASDPTDHKKSAV